MSDDQDTISRRTVLRNSAVAAGGLAAGGVATGTVAARLGNQGENPGGKRGGRAQIDGDADRNRPFTLQLEGADRRNASCMAEESAERLYLTYEIQYCDAEDDDEDAVMYVVPEEAELVESETYVIRSIQPCRDTDLQKVAFGPSQTEC